MTGRDPQQAIVTCPRGDRAGVAGGKVQRAVRCDGHIADAPVHPVEQMFSRIDPLGIQPVEMHPAKMSAIQRGDEEVVREAGDPLLRVERRTGRINRGLKRRGSSRSEQEVQEEIAALPVATRQPQASGDRLPVEAADDGLSRRDDR